MKGGLYLLLILLWKLEEGRTLVEATESNSSHGVLKRSATVPQQSCTSSNERDAIADTHQHDLVWICQSEDWTPYKYMYQGGFMIGTGTSLGLAGESCKHIRDELANNCFQTPQSGVYWVNYTDDDCEGKSSPIKVWCDMALDGGGWTLVWKHSYMEVSPLTPDMTYFSDYYKACSSLETGWCNLPGKTNWKPREMMLVAYHNKRVVYAYKAIFNRNVDWHWSSGILLNPQKVVDYCTKKNGVPPDPYIGVPGIAFDKFSTGSYNTNCDTIGGTASSPTECRWLSCHLPSSISSAKHRVQMTMAMYVR